MLVLEQGADGRLIYLRPSAGTNAYPSDGYAYTASSTFGSGASRWWIRCFIKHCY